MSRKRRLLIGICAAVLLAAPVAFLAVVLEVVFFFVVLVADAAGTAVPPYFNIFYPQSPSAPAPL